MSGKPEFRKGVQKEELEGRAGSLWNHEYGLFSNMIAASLPSGNGCPLFVLLVYRVASSSSGMCVVQDFVFVFMLVFGSEAYLSQALSWITSLL